MKKNINLKCLLDYKYLFLTLLMLSAFSSCKKENDIELIIHTRVAFENPTYLIDRDDNNEMVVTLNLSRPLEDKGSLVIAVDESSTADASNYSINPASVGKEIAISLQKGDSTVSFTIKSNHNFEESVIVGLSITSTSGALLPTTDNGLRSTSITLVGNRIAPALITSNNMLEDFGEVENGEESASQSYVLSGTNIKQDVTITVTENFEISLDDGLFASTLTIPAAEFEQPVSIYVKFVPKTGTDQFLYGSVTSVSEEAQNIVALSGIETGNEEIPDPPFFIENFEYGSASADLADVRSNTGVVFSEGISDWLMTNNGNSSSRMFKYLPTGLSIGSYPSAGGATSFSNGTAVNLSKTFNPISSGVVYTAVTINVANADGAAFFFSHMEGTGTHNRLYAQREGDNLKLGIARGTAAVYSAMSFNFNTTYVVVIKYDFATQESSLFVLDGSIPVLTEPAAANATSRGNSAPGAFEGIQLRQATGVLDATLDGIRVANSWRGALGI